MTLSECLDIAPSNLTVIENNDGTVSVFVNDNGGVAPIQLKKSCCEAIKSDYVFDINTQKCLWSTKASSKSLSSSCSLDEPFKLVLNPKGNDGTLFYVEDNDSCTLDIQFDYLFKIKCETLGAILTSNSGDCPTPVDVFETFDTSITIDIVTSANTLETVFEAPLLSTIGSGNLYTYLTENINSGFYVCGDPTGNETFSACTPLSLTLTANPQTNVYTCVNVIESIITGLYDEAIAINPSLTTEEFYGSFTQSALTSNWLTYKTTISDPTILSLIADKKIKLTIKVNKTCSDFCVLVDEISLNKVCTHSENKSVFLTQSPGFDLERIRDNKKSWVGNTTPTNRPFVITSNTGGNAIRQTNYDVNDERLVINTKEIDLDISLASAIETDVWCYLVDNSCLLSAATTCYPCNNEDDCEAKNFQDDDYFFFMDNEVYEFQDSNCVSGSSITGTSCCGDYIDFNSLLTQSLSGITTIEDFEYFMSSELIDAKSRKTLSGYPTLRALYDRYMNSSSLCQTNSSRFDYITMDQFANLVGDYWVDIVEQVIPATTIWGSVKVYSNTLFDQQKFKYRSYSSLFGGNSFSGQTVPSPIDGTHGNCAPIEVLTSSINIPTSGLTLTNPVITTSNAICLAQMNSGSEFIGSVTIIGPNQNNNNNGGMIYAP